MNRFIKSRHSALFYKWTELLANDPIKQIAKIEYIEDVAVNLAMFTHYFAYNQQLKERKRHILFTFDGPNAYLNYLTTLVEKFNIKNVEITLITNHHATNKNVEELNVDVVVCNYKDDNEILNCEMYKTERVPTEYDWEQIRSIVFYMGEIM